MTSVSTDAPAIRRRLPIHLLVTASAWGARLVSMAVQILCVRLLLAGLGSDRYAVYALLSSLLGWYMLADLGIGYSLQNFISECRAAGRDYRDYLSAALLSAAVLLAASLGIVFLVSPFVAPRLLGHFLFLSAAQKTQVFLAVGLFFTVFGISGMALKVWYALQKGYLSNILTALASLLTLAGVWWATRSGGSDRLLWSLVAAAAPAALAGLGAAGWLIAREPLRRPEAAVVRQVWGRALKFWASSLLALAVLEVDYIIMSQLLSSRDIVVYNLADKIFGVAYALYVAALQALWPVAAELMAKQEWDQVLRHVRVYLLAGLSGMALVTLIVMAWGQPIVALLSPKEHFALPPLFVLLFGVYQMVGIWTGTYATVLQSKNDLSPLLVWGLIQALVCAPLQWLLASRFGLYGIVLGLIGSYVFTVAWGLPLRVRRHVADYRAAQMQPV